MDKFLIIILVIILFLVGAGFYVFNKPTEINNQNQNMQNTTQSELKIEILKEGTGEGAKVGDNIAVNYTGTFENGEKFDSNVDPAFSHVEPFTYTLGQNMVIKGWEMGLLGMKVGEKRKLTIPYELGYGEAGRPPMIPAKSTLIFEIDMLSIN